MVKNSIFAVLRNSRRLHAELNRTKSTSEPLPDLKMKTLWIPIFKILLCFCFGRVFVGALLKTEIVVYGSNALTPIIQKIPECKFVIYISIGWQKYEMKIFTISSSLIYVISGANLSFSDFPAFRLICKVHATI